MNDGLQSAVVAQHIFRHISSFSNAAEFSIFSQNVALSHSAKSDIVYYIVMTTFTKRDLVMIYFTNLRTLFGIYTLKTTVKV